MALPDLTAEGHAITLGDADLSGADPRWIALNPQDFDAAAPKIRTNRRSRSGPYGRRSGRTSRIVDLQVLVVGDTGDDPKEALDENIAALRELTIDAEEDDFGGIPMTLTFKGGEVRSGSVQVDDFVPAPGHNERIVVMQITITGGALEPLGSA